MDVSIIYVNYKTVGLIIDSLTSVIEKTIGIKYEVIIVDNNSDDNSESLINQKFGSLVKYIPLAQNIGFGRANNEGVKRAQGRNVFFLNPDTLLCNNAICILSNYLDSNECVGACGGNLYDLAGQEMSSHRYFLPSLLQELDAAFFNLTHKIYRTNFFFNHTGRPLKVGYIIGADMMMKKKMFNELNGFDLDFFMFSEEVELSYRITKKGYSCVNVPTARIVHLEGQSTGEASHRMKLMFTGKSLYFKKRYGIIGLYIYIYILNLNFGIRKIIYFMVSNKDKYLIFTKMKKIIQNLNL